MRIKRAKSRKPVLELTPLVDVVFLLLTFYMLTSTFSRDEGIELQLPEADTAEASDKNTLVISLVDNSAVSISGATLQLVELRGYLENKLNNQTGVIVRSESDNQVQSLVSVLDQVRAAGGRNVTIATSASSTVNSGK